MDFVIQWLWYLLAFVAGSAVAWADRATALVASGRRTTMNHVHWWLFGLSFVDRAWS